MGTIGTEGTKVTKVELLCPSERKVIGEIPVNPQGDLSVVEIQRSARFFEGWKPQGPYLALLKDGTALQCPRCLSGVLLKHPGASIEEALKENLRLTLGNSRFAG